VAKMGRPSSFSQVAADEICTRIAKGESLRAICADEEAGWLPTATTVHRWLNDKDRADFREQYARARDAQADFYVDQIIEIADAPNATVNAKTGEPEVRDAQRDRLRVDARKWVAARLAPKKYGERLELAGEIENVTRVIADKPQTDEEWAEAHGADLGAAAGASTCAH